MAGYLNRVELIGNLGADPETRNFQDGGKIVNMRIATAEQWKDKESGERKEKTEWHSVVIKSEGLAKVAEQYLSKGSKVYVAGKLQTRKWQDKEGNDRYSTEVVLVGFDATLILLGDPRGGEGGGERREAAPEGKERASGARRPAAGGGNRRRDDMDDEIPF